MTYLIANWKMNGNSARVKAWASAMDGLLAAEIAAPRVVFCPPAPYISIARDALSVPAHIKLGAQDCHAQVHGAFTGETSAAMLADIGCSYVIVGHSERRANGETDAQVVAKAQAAVTAGLIPVVCVGESRADYEAKQTLAVLDAQLSPLRALPRGSYIIAYEPVWAIGSKQTPESLEIGAAHRHIKSILGSAVTVLYGGSVNGDNIKKIVDLPDVDGALIGGASLEIEMMRSMILACTK